MTMRMWMAVGLVAAAASTAAAEQKLQLENVYQSSGQDDVFTDPSSPPEDAQLEVLLDYANKCSEDVKQALAAGKSPKAPVEVRDGSIALGDAEAKVCATLRANVLKVTDARKAALEAEMAPYKKALTGDKLKIFLDREMFFTGVYGKGCKKLSNPAAFKKSAVWYVILIDDNGVVPMWTTRQYKFKGDKLATSGKEKTGRGSFPPSSGCP